MCKHRINVWQRLAIVLLACLFGFEGLFAATPNSDENPYSVIAKRNVFGLVPPPPPPAPPAEEPKEEEPPPTVRITGITTILGVRRALMKVQIPAKPPEPAREESHILVEGGPPEGGIQVLQILEEDEKVRIDNRGVIQTLALEKDTPKRAVPAAAATPVVANRSGVNIPQPPKVLANRALPTRSVRTPQSGSTPTGRGATGSNSSASYARRYMQPPNLTREEQVILMELQREQNLQGGGAPSPPLPITSLTPQAPTPGQ